MAKGRTNREGFLDAHETRGHDTDRQAVACRTCEVLWVKGRGSVAFAVIFAEGEARRAAQGDAEGDE